MTGELGPSEPQPRERPLGPLAEDFLRAILRGSQSAAEGVVTRAIADGLDGPAIYLSVFQPALERVGDLWQMGQIRVGDEHLATDVTRWMMAALLDDFRPRLVRNGGRVILAGYAPGEQHLLGLLMVVRFLRRDGWFMHNLGGDLPAEEFGIVAVKFRPALCLISAASLERIEAVARTTLALREAGVEAPVLVGGAIFRQDPSLVAKVGAAGTAPDAAAAVASVSALLGG